MISGFLEPKPSPPSPKAAPISLSELVEELLRFTLFTSLVNDSDVSLGFSREYCDSLLRDDPFSSSHISMMAGRGLPAYPLYKQLARALEVCIRSGKFLRDLSSVKGLRENESFKLKQKEWDRLIMEKGAELLNMMENVQFELHVQEPFFSQLRGEVSGRFNRIFLHCCYRDSLEDLRSVVTSKINRFCKESCYLFSSLKKNISCHNYS